MKPDKVLANAKLTEVKLKVEGMDCPDCALKIEKSLGRLDGISDIRLDFFSGKLSARATQIGASEIQKTINSLGYKASPVVAINGKLGIVPDRKVPAWKLWSLILSAVFSGLGQVLAFQGASPLLTHVVFLAGIVIGGWPIAWKGLLAARRIRLDMNFLMTSAVIGAILLGEWSEAAVVVILFSLAQLLEAYSLERSRAAITKLMSLTPSTATVLKNGREITVELENITVGATVLVKPGERIPVDGVILTGTSSVDQSSITGESLPVSKTSGAEVYAGTINQDGALQIRATHAPGDSTLDKIIHLVEEAQAQKAPSQSFVDSFSAYYTPTVVGIAALIAIIPPLFLSAHWHEWIYRGLALLVISCPCALVISTPVTIISGLANAARNGVLIKGGIHLESLHKIKTIAFDKTGTITNGKLDVTQVVSTNGFPESEIVRIAASIESHSEHPIAEAILRYAAEYNITFSEPVDFRAVPGQGASARLDGTVYFVGNRNFLQSAGVAVDPATANPHGLHNQIHTPIYVGNTQGLLGIITVADTIRPDSARVVGELKRQGIEKIALLTGDNRIVGESIARELNIDDVYSELLPHHKVDKIKQFRARYGEIAMIGDGINDAPALAVASLGIAMGGIGSDAVLETADIVLMNDDLEKIPWTIRLSRKVRAIIVQNIALALGIKLAFVILATAGLATLWMAVFADMGVSLMVIANGMRALRNS